MALIGKIRQNFWFVLIVLGLALAAFVVMDMTSANRGSAMNPTIGEINGTKINAQEFSATENVLSQNANGQDVNQRREGLWSYFVDKSLVEQQVEGLGLNVPVPELIDLQFGQNLSPIIQQSFYNPNTGQVDRQQLAQVQNMILTNSAQMSPDFKAFWRVQENQIIANQLQNKLGNIVGKGIYTPTWMATQEFKEKNTRAQVAYVKVPFDAVADDEVEVSDADIKAYLNDHKEEYSNTEETRVVDYITFPVIATASDSAGIFEDMTLRTQELLVAENDSIYAINNGGSKPTYFYSDDELPAALRGVMSDLNEGEIFGPYLDNGLYTSVKLVAKQSVPDSVQARVIFRQAPNTNQPGVAAAKTYLDSIKTLIVNGTEDFDSLAITNSQDGSASRGGDLGYLTQGLLPYELDKIIFLDGNRTGSIYEAETAAGVFLIELTDIIQRNNNDKFRLANIISAIVPSKATQDSVLDVVNDFLSDHRKLESMRTGAQEKNHQILSAAPANVNSFVFGNFGSDQTSRDIVRWAFEDITEVGDVSPDLFEYQDPIQYYTNNYVIVGLSDIIPKGLSKVDAVRDYITPLVRNMKKGEAIKSAITSSDLSAVATQYSLKVDTLSAVTMASNLIPSLGSEPKVIAAIFATAENTVAGPIVGNSGVYVLKPIAIAPAGEATSIPSLRNSSMNLNRSKVQQALMGSLKKDAKIEDNRFGYGF